MNASIQKFSGIWEQINNSNLKVVEFDHFKIQASLLTMGQQPVAKFPPLNSPRIIGPSHES